MIKPFSSRVHLSSKIRLDGLSICSIFRGKNCTSTLARVQFSGENWNELTDQQDMFCFNHASTFYTSKDIVKMLMNNKVIAKTLTGNPTGNYRWQLLESRALNMSCSFSQSARTIESRCLVIYAVEWTGQSFRAKINIFISRVKCLPVLVKLSLIKTVLKYPLSFTN